MLSIQKAVVGVLSVSQVQLYTDGREQSSPWLWESVLWVITHLPLPY